MVNIEVTRGHPEGCNDILIQLVYRGVHAMRRMSGWEISG